MAYMSDTWIPAAHKINSVGRNNGNPELLFNITEKHDMSTARSVLGVHSWL